MAAYKKRRTQLHRKKKHSTLKKTRCRKLLPKRKKQLFKRKILGRKTVSKKMLNKKMSNKKLVGKKVVNRKAEPRYQDLKRPYDEFIIKVLQRLQKDKVPISTKAKGKMINFIKLFYNNVSEKAKDSKRYKESCTIGSRELQSALKRVMRKKHAMELVKTIRNVSRRR